MKTPDQNLPPIAEFESPVAPRFSFADRENLRLDLTFQTGMRKRRVISYPESSPVQASVRDALIAKGAVLGQQCEQEAGIISFLVPASARPISHEASSARVGSYSYDDSRMFSDMGYLLALLARQGGAQPYVLRGEIGQNLALVEFTREDEPKVLLVPGFEMSLRNVLNDNAALEHYARGLHEDFGSTFERNIEHFAAAFDATYR